MPDADLDAAAGSVDTGGSTSTQSTDTASAASVSTDTTAGNPSATGTSAEAGSAVAENRSVDGTQQASLAVGAEADAVKTTSISPADRQYREVQGWATRVRQENIALQQQLQELRQQVDGFQQKQSTTQYPAHDERSPDHQEFMRYHDKADFYEELIQGENDPAEVQKLQAKMHRVLGERGIAMLNGWRTDVRNQERERRLNPKAFYSKLIRQEAQPVVQETLQSTSQNYQQMIQARDAAQKWIKDNPEVASRENVQAVLSLMEKGIKFDVASSQVERDHYRKLVSDAKRMSASAGEKERLLQGNAAGAISRNPNASKRIDVDKLRKEKGIQDSRGFTDLLFDLDRQGLL